MLSKPMATLVDASNVVDRTLRGTVLTNVFLPFPVEVLLDQPTCLKLSTHELHEGQGEGKGKIQV